MTDALEHRWAWAAVDLDAIRHNVARVRDEVDPAAVWAVVKANGYGHGATEVATAAIEAGAAGLCVALAAEGIALRQAGIGAPILVLSEQPPDLIGAMIEHRLTPTVYTPDHVRVWANAAAAHIDGSARLGVHVKIDTGMQRVGAPLATVDDLIDALVASDATLIVEGTFTHLACADAPDDPANDAQLTVFDAALDLFEQRGIDVGLVHAANSAAALSIPSARRALVRLGIAMYGISPGSGVDPAIEALPGGLRPALSLRARVSMVKHVDSASAVSYGLRHRFDRATTLATVPIGYADGVARRLGTGPDRPGVEVLVRGHRCRIVGVVTMDQLVVDVGDLPVEVGDEVVLIGDDAADRIAAEDWANHLGTIGYEIVCGISARVPRRYGGESTSR